MRTALFFALLWIMGCAAALPILQGLAMGAQMLGHVLDAADIGAGKFFARHPNMEREHATGDALLNARQKTVDCDRLVIDEREQEARAACTKAVEAYDELYDLLDAMGVLDGKCRDCGGAEGDAPEPGPLKLPTPAAIAVAMKE